MGLSDIDEDDDDVVVHKPCKHDALHNKQASYVDNASSKYGKKEELYINQVANQHSNERSKNFTKYVDLDDLFDNNDNNNNIIQKCNVECRTQQEFSPSFSAENSSPMTYSKVKEGIIVGQTVNCIKGNIKVGRCVKSGEEIHDVIYESHPVMQAKPNTSPFEKEESKAVNFSDKEHDVLDNLFATPTSAENPTCSKVNDDANTIIYVDGPEAQYEHDCSNLLDLSKPSQRKRHDDAESFLKDFEQQGKKAANDRLRFEKEDSLQKLTRNKDDNKVKARLLALMNYYDVLGVSSNATLEEIKASYKRKALELHPDKVGDKQTPEEAELFKIITKAHEVLSDDQQRAEYDAELQMKSPEYIATQNEWLEHLGAFVEEEEEWIIINNKTVAAKKEKEVDDIIKEFDLLKKIT